MDPITWNDLLIGILDMTPEERKAKVSVSDESMFGDPDPIYKLKNDYNGPYYLSTSKTFSY